MNSEIPSYNQMLVGDLYYWASDRNGNITIMRNEQLAMQMEV